MATNSGAELITTGQAVKYAAELHGTIDKAIDYIDLLRAQDSPAIKSETDDVIKQLRDILTKRVA